MAKPTTIRELRDSGYASRSVKQEMRDNLIARLRSGEALFPGIVGYEETVIPQIENAILSGQDIVFLGERGQAKTRIARLLVGLLDEEMPGARRLRDQRRPVRADLPGRAAQRRRRAGRRRADRLDPARPALRREARHARHHHRRPDRRGRPDQGRRGPLPLRRADDPLRARARAPTAASSRINELPDLAERIQVGLLNIMEERDVQIRGYKVRLPLDVFVVATREPGGLHQPRPHHHAAQGPLRLADPHALPASGSRTRSRSWRRSARSFADRRARDRGARST